MSLPVRSFCRGALIAGATLFATSASAQMELKIIAPAAPGGGWDQTARSIQQALIAEKLVKAAQQIGPDRLHDVRGVELGAEGRRQMPAHHRPQVRQPQDAGLQVPAGPAPVVDESSLGEREGLLRQALGEAEGVAFTVCAVRIEVKLNA
jgi:hypothetical protein